MPFFLVERDHCQAQAFYPRNQQAGSGQTEGGDQKGGYGQSACAGAEEVGGVEQPAGGGDAAGSSDADTGCDGELEAHQGAEEGVQGKEEDLTRGGGKGAEEVEEKRISIS